MSALLRVSALLLGASSIACSVPVQDTGVGPRNSCAADEDCGGSGACVALPTGNACVALQADLASLIFEVRTLSSSSGSTISRVIDEGLTLQGDKPEGFVVTHDLPLPPLLAFEGVAIAFKPLEVSCAGADGSIPVDIELRTQAPYHGLGETYRGATSASPEGLHTFALKVPPGLYDVVVAPTSCDDGAAPPPPQYLPDVDVSVDTTIHLEMAQPLSLTGTLELPLEEDVDGWTLEVVEPERGVVVSQSLVLSREEVVDGLLSITSPAGEGPLRYSWADGAIVRLRDDEGLLTVHWPMSSIDLDGDGDVALRLYDLEFAPKNIEAAVVDELGGPVVATVVLQSTVLTGSANQNASFEVRATTNDAGLFAVDLVPGSYKVQAFPVESEGAAAVEVEWEIKETDLCCGRTITAPPQSTLQGAAATELGQPMAFAPVEARPSSQGVLSYLDLALAVDPLIPAAASSTLDAGGAFKLSVDPSSYDFFIKPPLGTGFPWVVRPSTRVEGSAQALDLGALKVSYPAVLVGGVSTATGEPTSAVIRAWLPITVTGSLGAEGPGAVRVVQIGEAVADDAGRYVLVLPPSIVPGVVVP